jgi:pimeloyl-ACP methyl ester carboxylesterase
VATVRSGKPHDHGAYDRNQIADDVIAVMDAAALDRADLMGYSIGGRIAISLLARFQTASAEFARAA